MEQRRVSLYDPAFAGRLRQVHRRPAYVARPTVVARPTAAVKPQPITDQPAAMQPVPTTPVMQRSWQRWRSTALYGMALLLFVTGLAVAINGLRANRKVAAQVTHLTSTAQADDNDSGAHPSTQKPSPASIAGYAVAPNLPRYIDIPKLAVHARILSMGVTISNQLKAPGNVYDAGWYNASAQPGQPGAMLIDGHISSWTTQGVFYGLNKLTVGDDVTVTRGDGQRFTYTVVKTELANAQTIDMGSLLVSKDSSKPGLSLISCAGEVIPGSNEFAKRQIVYAVLQN